MSRINQENFKKYIQNQENFWLEKFSSFVECADTLKIGNGLGHLSKSIRPYTESLVILDIDTFPKTINKDNVHIYDGYHIPYADKSFETTIIIFTLHHIPRSHIYFQEIMRVTKKRIIILEETYDNTFQKVHLYYRDWIVNKNAEQPCELYWNGYFSRKELNDLIKKNNLQEIYRITKKHKSYFKELVVLDIPMNKEF